MDHDFVEAIQSLTRREPSYVHCHFGFYAGFRDACVTTLAMGSNSRHPGSANAGTILDAQGIDTLTNGISRPTVVAVRHMSAIGSADPSGRT